MSVVHARPGEPSMTLFVRFKPKGVVLSVLFFLMHAGRGIGTEALRHDREHTFVCLRVTLQNAQDGPQCCILFLEPSHLQAACAESD